jgi:hypothetical protein
MADQPSLTVLGGPLGGRRFAFEDGSESVLIGSDPSCTFRLELPGVSPIHARVRMENGVILVYDTQSPRGLFVNDDRVTTQMPLRNGDVLWLGTPGEPGVVMIQCRVPPTSGATASAAAAANPPTAPGTESTQAISEEPAMYAEPVLEPEPTMAMRPEPEPAPTLIQAAPSEGADSFFGEDHDATQSMPAPAPPRPAAPALPSDDQLPTSFSVEPPPLMAHTPVPAPLHFEDEDEGQAATAIMPPYVGGDSTPAPPAPEPPPPPPPPAPKPAAPARPATPVQPRPAAKPAGPPSMRMDRKPGTASMPPRPATPPRRPVPAGGGGGGKTAIIAGGGLLAVIAIAGAVWFFVLRKPGPTQTATATPVATAAATTPPIAAPTAALTAAPTSEPTPVEEVVTIVSPTAAVTEAPTPAPATAAPTSAAPTIAAPRAATPRAAAAATKTAGPTSAPSTPNPAALAAAAKDQGDRALTAGQFDAAVGHYDEALRLSPGHPDATAGRAKAIAARDAGKRRFVPGTTSVKSAKQGKADLTGFESSDVKVAGALEYSGRIDFEVKPERVKPGDPYTIRVFLTNDGKKELKIGSVNVSYVSNGNKSGGPVSPRVKQVAPQANVLLEEFPGTWGEGTTSWSMEVVIASNRGDTFRNQLTWK